MSLFAFSGLLTGLSSVVFGTYVFVKNKRGRIEDLFFLFALSVSLWGFSTWWLGLAGVASEASLTLWRLAHIGLILMPALFLHFIHSLLDVKKSVVLRLTYVLAAVFSVLNLVDLLVQSEASRSFFLGRNLTEPHIFNIYSLFIFLWSVAMIFIYFELSRAYRKAVGLLRAQVRFLLLSFVPFFLILLLNFLPLFGAKFFPVINILLSLSLFLMADALLSQRFADLRAVFRRSFVFAVSALFLLLAAFLLEKSLIVLFGRSQLVFHSIIILGVAVAFPGIKKFFDHVAGRYLFVSAYDDRRLAMAVGDELKSSFDLKKNYLLLYDVLYKAFHFKGFCFFDFRDGEDIYGVFYSDGFGFDKKMTFAFDEKTLADFISQDKLVVCEELRRDCADESICATVKRLTQLGIEVVVPLNINSRQIGFLGLGAKESGDIYDQDDLRVLETITAQLAVAFENALLYRETINFNVRLTEEIEKSTFELREANRELLKLDKAKSEFISIASHQLRTPLTIVKGYVSMIIEGLYGAITPEIKESLEKINESNQRLIRLVESLLLVSRIESSKLQIIPVETDVAAMARSVLADVEGIAGKKKIVFMPDIPVEPVLAQVDKDKMKQVMYSLVDNAVRYSVYGKVKVALKVVNERFEFSVVDSGIGITAEEKESLFRKFYRGPKAPLMHTEGVGIGLFVAKEIIEAHGGRIWAKSEGEGAGSEFLFYVPLH